MTKLGYNWQRSNKIRHFGGWNLVKFKIKQSSDGHECHAVTIPLAREADSGCTNLRQKGNAASENPSALRQLEIHTAQHVQAKKPHVTHTRCWRTRFLCYKLSFSRLPRSRAKQPERPLRAASGRLPAALTAPPRPPRLPGAPRPAQTPRILRPGSSSQGPEAHAAPPPWPRRESCQATWKY